MLNDFFFRKKSSIQENFCTSVILRYVFLCTVYFSTRFISCFFSVQWKVPISSVAAFFFKLLQSNENKEYKSPLKTLQLPQSVIASAMELNQLKDWYVVLCFFSWYAKTMQYFFFSFPVGKEMDFFQECMIILHQFDAGILYHAIMLYTAASQVW